MSYTTSAYFGSPGGLVSCPAAQDCHMATGLGRESVGTPVRVFRLQLGCLRALMVIHPFLVLRFGSGSEWLVYELYECLEPFSAAPYRPGCCGLLIALSGTRQN